MDWLFLSLSFQHDMNSWACGGIIIFLCLELFYLSTNHSLYLEPVFKYDIKKLFFFGCISSWQINGVHIVLNSMQKWDLLGQFILFGTKMKEKDMKINYFNWGRFWWCFFFFFFLNFTHILIYIFFVLHLDFLFYFYTINI